MVASSPIRSLFLYAAAVLYLLSVGTTGVSADGGKSQDDEVQMGNEVFNELKAKGEIIESSPWYDQLEPIADAITRSAQPRYNHPFKFFLVHEAQPNAFATPGGNIYVVDSLLYFVKNRSSSPERSVMRLVAVPDLSRPITLITSIISMQEHCWSILHQRDAVVMNASPFFWVRTADYPGVISLLQRSQREVGLKA